MNIQNIVLALCLISGLSFACNSKNNTETNGTNTKKDAVENEIAIVDQKWELPSVLKEVSGIAYVDSQRFVCVQDEDGVIFLFNIKTSEIEKQIKFASGGDYEGIALVKDNAYVVRSDGKIFEIAAWQNNNPTVNEFETPLTAEQNIESLCYDALGNRLLLAIKDEEPDTKDYKGIYGFDLVSMKLAEDPVYKIDLTNEAFQKLNEKDQEDFILPSEINIHPKTGDIYIIEGKDPKLLILDKNGNIKSVDRMNKKDFPQAEGLTFSPGGELFISNEGGKKPGNILKVSLNFPEN